jgi:hypothetical protein
MSIENLINKIKLKYIKKKEIKEKYDIKFNIDYIIENENYNICIINLYYTLVTNNILIENINNINKLFQITKKKHICLFLTRNEFNQESTNLLINENIKLNNIYHHIYNDNFHVILKLLTDLFYQNNIFLYDNDSCIMNY